MKILPIHIIWSTQLLASISTKLSCMGFDLPELTAVLACGRMEEQDCCDCIRCCDQECCWGYWQGPTAPIAVEILQRNSTPFSVQLASNSSSDQLQMEPMGLDLRPCRVSSIPLLAWILHSLHLSLPGLETWDKFTSMGFVGHYQLCTIWQQTYLIVITHSVFKCSSFSTFVWNVDDADWILHDMEFDLLHGEWSEVTLKQADHFEHNLWLCIDLVGNLSSEWVNCNAMPNTE